MNTNDNWTQRETDDLWANIDTAWGAVMEFRGQQYNNLPGRALAALCVASSELAAAQQKVALLVEELMIAVAEKDSAYQYPGAYSYAEVINVARRAAEVAAEIRADQEPGEDRESGE